MAASLTACGSSKTSTPDTTGAQTTAAGSETKAGGETKAEEAPAGAVEQVVTIPMFSDPDTLDPVVLTTSRRMQSCWRFRRR